MAVQWMALARTTTFALFEASFQPLGPSFIPASEALHVRARLLTRGTVVPLLSFDLDGPTAMLEEASRAIARYSELHNRVVRVFCIYGRLLGVLRDGPLSQRNLTAHPHADPMWQIWVQRRADALDRTDQATRRLRAVATFDLATVDAFTVARSFPENSPSRNSWMRAAESLAVRAEAEARATSQSETIMCSAVSWEYLVGLAIFIP